MLYARALLLRNCGRFTHISSDFGSDYHTHMFVTSEALYASLTRGATWRHAGRFIELEEDAKKAASPDYFFCDYDVKNKPVWFTPGLFVDKKFELLEKQRGIVDRNDFNVIDEDYPSTGANGRPYFVPTYGSIEGVLPDNWLFTWAISPDNKELDSFDIDQVFLLGKKRTMFQIIRLSSITEGILKKEKCRIPYLQFSLDDIDKFEEFNILATAFRYILLKGKTSQVIECYAFSIKDKDTEDFYNNLILPTFYLDRIPW